MTYFTRDIFVTLSKICFFYEKPFYQNDKAQKTLKMKSSLRHAEACLQLFRISILSPHKTSLIFGFWNFIDLQ